MDCQTGYLLWIQNYAAGINRKAKPEQYEHTFSKGGSSYAEFRKNHREDQEGIGVIEE